VFTVHLAASLTDLVLPVRCLACGRAHVALCRHCVPLGPLVPLAPLPDGGLGGGHGGYAAAPYAGVLRTALVAYKERGRHDLAPPLGALLGAAVTGVLAQGELWRRPGVLLVAVPSARASARARGGDHVARLARLAAGGAGLSSVRALSQVRRIRDSAGLGAAQRQVNVSSSMAACPPAPGAAAIIVDDIVTSGATLTEAARALRLAGWPVLGAAVVAATPHPDRHRTARTPTIHSRSPGTYPGSGLA
jgi:predicted amidophosphoribosyltransferase